MPKARFCPTCEKRMIRLYEREHLISKSKYWGYLWLCPNKHTVIIEHRKSKTQEIYEMKEVLVDAST